jgi:parallel beta helix pectate lyase-like protein
MSASCEGQNSLKLFKRVAGAVFLTATLAAADLGGAQRTFVSAASGDDTNPCSRPLPCRNFAAAIVLTDNGGEVVVLDSGGYGVVTIPKPISIISAKGVYAGVTAFSFGTAITVNAGDTGHVILRNLHLNSHDANVGIDADTVASLLVEGCTITGFSLQGILFDPSTAGARLAVSNTVVRHSGNTGIFISGGTDPSAVIEATTLQKNTSGIYFDHATGSIRGSLASGGVNYGFAAAPGSKVAVEDSVSTNNGYGFYAYATGVMTMTRCTAAGNTYGAAADGTLYVSDSIIVRNGTGIAPLGSGIVRTRVNNTVEANTNNGTFSSTYAAD